MNKALNKPVKQFLKATVIFLGILSLKAQAQVKFQSGSYSGLTLNRARVEMYVQKMTDRSNSYLAVIVKNKDEGFPYVIEQENENLFHLTPLRFYGQAMIGPSNPNPTMTMTQVTHQGKLQLKLVPNESGNSLGFKETIYFRLPLIPSLVFNPESKSGKYDLQGKVRLLSRFDDVQVSEISGREARAVFTSRDGTHGNYVLRHVRSGLYVLLSDVMTVQGSDVQEEGEKMGFFLNCNKGSLFGYGSFFVMMETESGKLSYFKLK
jgi:hypothetical protein